MPRGDIGPVPKVCMSLHTINVRGEAYQANEIAIDHHTCDHRGHFAKERADEQMPKEIYRFDVEAPYLGI